MRWPSIHSSAVAREGYNFRSSLVGFGALHDLGRLHCEHCAPILGVESSTYELFEEEVDVQLCDLRFLS